MPKLTLVLVASHIMKDRMMHAVDLFETWKVLMEPALHISCDGRDGDTLRDVINKAGVAITKSGEYRVIALFHPFLPEGAFCDRSIVMVSTGNSFCKFADYLESLGYAGPMPRRYPNEPVPTEEDLCPPLPSSKVS